MPRLLGLLAGLLNLALSVLVSADEPAVGLAKEKVDATTPRHKVMCGYQGWFRCPGDGTDDGWLHWSRDRQKITPRSLTVEMWPDMSELGQDEKYPVPDFSAADGAPVALFSSAHPRTVARHFDWMRQYDIDGAFLQRFLVNRSLSSFDRVLANVRQAADQSGRCYAICYDLSGMPAEKLFDAISHDWKRLVDDLQVTRDDRYLHHHGKPVVFVWGFFSDRFEPTIAHQIIDFFHAPGPYAATLTGGCQWTWREEKNPDWARAFRRLDIISPWNVGNYKEEGDRKFAATGTWSDDAREARRAGAGFLPVLYPGFAWTNLKGALSEQATLPRLGGEFYWRQFVDAQEVGADMAYVAMFDEVDEATAIFKVSNLPPTQARLATYESLPADWYLRLTREGARLMRTNEQTKPSPGTAPSRRYAMPIQP